MELPQIVLDTNVLVAALRSKRGASHRLLQLIDADKFEINLPVSLALEYEEATKRLIRKIGLTKEGIDDILDYVLAVANQQEVHYLWRPLLPDPKDDMVVELAVAANCSTIITFNKRDFREAQQFGIEIQTPQEFLKRIGEIR